MHWNQLTDLDKREISSYYISNPDLHYDIRQSLLAEKYDVSKRTIRRWLSDLNVTQGRFDKRIDLHPQYLAAKERRVPDSMYYAVMWEQNETPIIENLWRNVIKYCDFIGGCPLVIQGRYQNPTSIWKDKISNEGWSHTTEPYQYNSQLRLHPYLEVMGGIKVRPTAVNPLSGLGNITGLNTGILGHPKLHFETMSMPKSYRKKVLATTGSLTMDNYTESKDGNKALSKHKLGFTLVEVRNDEIFHIRQIEADEQGNFYDLFFEVKDGNVSINNRSLGIVFGDTHIGGQDPDIMEKNKELVKLLNPQKVVYHDILDGVSVNNHIQKRPLQQYERYKKGEHLIEKEIQKLFEFLHDNARENSYIVRSNHGIRFDNYIESMDWKKDIPNAEQYMQMASVLLSGDAPKGIIPWFIDKEFNSEYYKCLGIDDSLIVGKYEAGMHGHKGANGSRGGITQFNKIDIPTITGHGHTTARRDDTIIVGSNTLYEQGYNEGPSNWLHSNVVIHPNGIAQQVSFIEGEYTTLTKFL